MAFTKENAGIHASNGGKARWLAYYAMKEQQTSTVVEQPKPDDSDSYRMERLVRVRKQLDMIDAEITKEAAKNPDGKRLKELVEAQNRLDGQEWSLSNRHKPSVAKPSSKPTKRQQSSFHEPIPCESDPVVQVQVTPQVVAGDWAAMLF